VRVLVETLGVIIDAVRVLIVISRNSVSFRFVTNSETHRVHGMSIFSVELQNRSDSEEFFETYGNPTSSVILLLRPLMIILGQCLKRQSNVLISTFLYYVRIERRQ
jgi:hypothetical protein